MQYRPVLLLLFLLLLKIVTCSTHTKQLKPFEYITGELIDLDGEARAYQLSGLKPSTGYEVRLSFPASVSSGSVKRLKRSMLKVMTTRIHEHTGALHHAMATHPWQHAFV
jgi:hypothetical protein